MLRRDEPEPDAPRPNGEGRDEPAVLRNAGPTASLMHALDEHLMMACADGAGRITFVNPRSCRVLQRTPDEIVGQQAHDVGVGLPPPDTLLALRGTFSRGEVWRGELSGNAKDGTALWLSATIVPLATRDGPSRSHMLRRLRCDFVRAFTSDLP